MSQEIVTAPIPGKIIKVSASEGLQISEGDTICEIESMKMENPIPAPVSGTVKEVAVAIGKVVKSGDTLAVIEY